MSEKKEVYLGDGLYASFDGFMILLRAPRRHEDHWVGLEPEVFGELMKFAEGCWKPKESREIPNGILDEQS
jgi:hypothetical protein